MKWLSLFFNIFSNPNLIWEKVLWNSVSIVVDGTCKSIQYSRCILLNVVKKLVDTANRLNS